MRVDRIYVVSGRIIEAEVKSGKVKIINLLNEQKTSDKLQVPIFLDTLELDLLITDLKELQTLFDEI